LPRNRNVRYIDESKTGSYCDIFNYSNLREMTRVEEKSFRQRFDDEIIIDATIEELQKNKKREKT